MLRVAHIAAQHHHAALLNDAGTGNQRQQARFTDTIRSNQPFAPTLDYGQTQSVNTITCDSEPSGITCTDESTGHFITLSAESNTLG